MYCIKMRRPHVPGPTRILAAGILAAAMPAIALAQAGTALPPIQVGTQQDGDTSLTTTQILPDALAAKARTTDDTAQLFSDVPGVNVITNGGISGLPTIHGLADDRIKTLVDGIPVTASCPNHMNPALSYVAPTAVGKAEIIAGITPVSQGGDSIGGTISVEPAAPVFAAAGEGIRSGGQLASFYRSVNTGVTSSIDGSVAGEASSFGVNLTRAQAEDYHDGDGDPVHATRYKNWTGDGMIALRGDSSLLILRADFDYTPYEGFVNQPMDLTYNRGVHVDGHYSGEFAWGNLEARLYWQDVRHEMNFLFGFQDGPGGGMPMLTHGQDVGYAVKAEIPLSARDDLRVGTEFHRYTLNDWWPPAMMMVSMMGPNTFENISDGQRNVVSAYAEWEKAWDAEWTTLLGVRNDTVLMDTGDVQGYNASMAGMYYYAADAAAFNAQDHRKTDVNFDVTALARYQTSEINTNEIGYARKTRSPNLYERYTWSSNVMASSMIGWFGDFNSYVGNVDLKPETANTVSASTAWHDAAKTGWEIKATPYYTYIQNYIGVDTITSFNGHAVSGTLLRFANHDSEMFGADLSGRATIARDATYGEFGIKGTVGWARGWQLNDDRNLYHLMPINGKVGLEHALGRWSSGLEVLAVGHKDFVDTQRNEPETPGYALVNLRTSYGWSNVTFSGGIDNLLNRQYYEPLGGVDYKDLRYNDSRSAVAAWERNPNSVPGMGRSFNAGVSIKF